MNNLTKKEMIDYISEKTDFKGLKRMTKPALFKIYKPLKEQDVGLATENFLKTEVDEDEDELEDDLDMALQDILFNKDLTKNADLTKKYMKKYMIKEIKTHMNYPFVENMKDTDLKLLYDWCILPDNEKDEMCFVSDVLYNMSMEQRQFMFKYASNRV